MTPEEKAAELKRLSKKQKQIKKKIDKMFADTDNKSDVNPFLVAATICRLVIDASIVQHEIRKVGAIESKGKEPIIKKPKPPEPPPLIHR